MVYSLWGFFHASSIKALDIENLEVTLGAAEGLLLNTEAAEIINYHFFRCCFNNSKFIWAIVGKWKHFFYFVHFPHISAMTKYFTSTQLLIFSTSGKIFQPQLF